MERVSLVSPYSRGIFRCDSKSSENGMSDLSYPKIFRYSGFVEAFSISLRNTRLTLAPVWDTQVCLTCSVKLTMFPNTWKCTVKAVEGTVGLGLGAKPHWCLPKLKQVEFCLNFTKDLECLPTTRSGTIWIRHHGWGTECWHWRSQEENRLGILTGYERVEYAK